MSTRRAAERASFRTRPEARWPVLIAIGVAVLMYALLPQTFVTPLRYTVVGLCILLAIPLVLVNPTRLDRETRVSRAMSITIAIVLLAANQIALVQLIIDLVRASRSDPPVILLAAVQVWITNVIGYSVVYWEMDRGGPIARRRDPRDQLPDPDFQFPQDADGGGPRARRAPSATADWSPSYFDYLYFSASDAMAFSATDVMPLTHRAKAFMLAESLSGFALLALVIARSVNLLG